MAGRIISGIITEIDFVFFALKVVPTGIEPVSKV